MLLGLVRLMGHRRWPLVLVALALLLSLPALGGGLALDDYVLRAKLTGDLPMPADWNPYLDMFRFTSGDPGEGRWLVQQGYAPWWMDQRMRAAFFRPLSAATHLLDRALWPEALPLHHLHSLLWYALLVLLGHRLYRRLSASAAAAGLAALMFAVDDAHYLPVMWLSHRNALVALTLGVAALLLHLRWRRRGGWHHLALALCALAAALCGGEAALGAAAYIAAYQLTLDRGPLVTRLTRLAPYAALLAAWAVIYSALGYGASFSGMYVDPLREPLHFFQVMVERLPTLLLAQWGGSVDAWMFLPRYLQLALAGAGLLVTLGLAWLFAPLLRQRAEARFWTLGMVLSLLPVCATFPMDRLVLAAGIGAFGLLACQVDQLGWLSPESAALVPRTRRWAFKLLLVANAALLPLLPLRMLAFQQLSGRVDEDARRLPGDRAVPQQTFVFLNGVETAYVYTPLVRKAEGLRAPRRTALLAPLLARLELRRPDRQTLVIRADGGYFVHPGERLFWGPQRPFAQGEQVSTVDHQVRVTRITDDGRPLEVSFRFKVPLEHRSLRWFYARAGHMVPFTPPAVGQAVTVQPAFSSINDFL